MYDHLGLKVKNLDASVGFYGAALAPLGHVLASRDQTSAGFGPPGEPALWLYLANGAASPGMHVAFRAADRAAGAITAGPACAPNTAPAITPRSCSIRTATMSRRCAFASGSRRRSGSTASIQSFRSGP